MNSDETWKPIPGYDGLYDASSFGRIRRNGATPKVKKARVLHPRKVPVGRGYYRVTLSVNGKTKYAYVHRLVAMAFHGKPADSKETNHKDGDTANNRPDNLEWVTHSENIQHSYDELGRVANRGGPPCGEDHWNSKLSSQEVLAIRKRYNPQDCLRFQLATEYGVSQKTIEAIVYGYSWRHLLDS